MNSIPLTRYNLSRYYKVDRRRCEEAYVRVKQRHLTLGRRGIKVDVEHGALGIADSHVRTGIILRKYRLYRLAAEQFERADELLALF